MDLHTPDHDEQAAKTRVLTGYTTRVISLIAIAMSIFHVYTAIFGVFQSITQRSVHLAFAIVLTFLLYPLSKRGNRKKVSWFDWLAVLLTVVSYGYFILNGTEIGERISYVMPLSGYEMFVGITAGLLLLEATRRAIGNTLVIIIVIALAYVFWGNHLGGLVGHKGFSFMWIVDHLFYTTSGIYSVPLGISATFIFMFVLFGKFLETTGAGKFFIDLAVAVMGKYRGGPAKTAITASAFMGSISGSAVANTVSTGSITIPLMKKTGYKGDFAGAVEAVASTGGQIMPPIMGAAAFVIASYLGVSYIEVVIAAIIPALFYYICLFFQVDFRAKRSNLRGMRKDELPQLKQVLKEGFLYFIPLIVIVYMLILGYSPMRAGLYGIVAVLIVAILLSRFRFDWRKLFRAFDMGARAMIETAIACAAAGFVIGVVSLTGIGLKFSSMILHLAGENLFLVLFFTMITSIILGMGLPTVAAYIVQVSLTVPALVELGVTPLAAHMFIFYFAILSNITPPVALATFAAAGIANANPMKTGLHAVRLGIAGYIIPYMFVYGNELLLMGKPWLIGLAVLTGLVAIYAMSAAVEGWLLHALAWYERLLLFVGAICLVFPGLQSDAIGLVLLLITFIIQKTRKRGDVDGQTSGMLA